MNMTWFSPWPSKCKWRRALFLTFATAVMLTARISILAPADSRLGRKTVPPSGDRSEAAVQIFGRPIPYGEFQIAFALGSAVRKQALRAVLDSRDPNVVKAAIASLSAMGGEDVAHDLARILADPKRSTAVRMAAAEGLCTIGSWTARQAIPDALKAFSGDDSATQQLWRSLGQLSFPMVADVFEAYLAAPDSPQGLRVNAAEALANSSPEAVPYLLALAQSDSDPTLRAAAAWAISMHQESTDLAPGLSELIQGEADADVRRRLYEALLPQQDIPAATLIPQVMQEEDFAARIAGFNAIGKANVTLPNQQSIIFPIQKVKYSAKTGYRLNLTHGKTNAGGKPGKHTSILIRNMTMTQSGGKWAITGGTINYKFLGQSGTANLIDFL